MGLSLYAAPSEEPVSLTEAKAQLRLEHTNDDTLVSSLIVASRRWVERVTGRSLVTQTWTMYLDEFPCEGMIYVPRGPVASITSITYVDTAGSTQTMSASDYLLDASVDPARLDLAWGAVWPFTQPRINAVTIRFVAGYGAASAVPDDLKHVMKMLIAHWYEHREGVVTGTISSALQFSIDALVDPYRILSPLAA